MLVRSLLILLVSFFTIQFSTLAQNVGESGEIEVHQHEKNEVGVANSVVYFLNEKVLTYGLHAHYVRIIRNSRFGAGVGYEKIFDEHKHQTISVVGQFQPIDNLFLNIAPGFVFEENNIKTSVFAIHFEGSYEFEIKNFHIGPLVELAYDIEDIHVSIGLHTAIGF